MRAAFKYKASRVFLACSLLLPACGAEDSEGEGDDVPASGGILGTGGASGGALGSGGAPGNGGAQGSGGAQAGSGGTGGSPVGSGGMPGAGGISSGGGEPATGGDTSTGGAEGAEFLPCPSEGPCKILPLGDSITFGLEFDGGYRVELFRLAQEAGHDITFTGTQAPNGPDTVAELPFPKNHEGISGETIQQIADRIPSPGLNEIPHIVLVHAGTNDMWAGASGAPDRLGSLLDELLTEAPEALIVVSNIIPWPDQSGAVATYNAGLVTEVEERMQTSDRVVFVDQFEGFPANELGDGIHPNEAGYARMAGKWYDAIEAYLP